MCREPTALESCLIWMSHVWHCIHVSYKWVTSHNWYTSRSRINKSWLRLGCNGHSTPETQPWHQRHSHENTFWITILCNTLQHTATHCTHCNALQRAGRRHQVCLTNTLQHCNTLQHTTTHFITLQQSATHCNTLQQSATHCNTLQHTATHYNALHHTAAQCNTLQRARNGSIECVRQHKTQPWHPRHSHQNTFWTIIEGFHDNRPIATIKPCVTRSVLFLWPPNHFFFLWVISVSSCDGGVTKMTRVSKDSKRVLSDLWAQMDK